VNDFAYLAPLLLAMMLGWVLLKRTGNLRLAGYALIWMAAWAAVFLPWIFVVEYYMLALGLGVAFLAGLWIHEMAQFFRSSNRWLKSFTIVGLVGFVLLFASTIPNLYTNARLQLETDAANAAMLDYLSQTAPLNSVVWVNIQQPNEYFYEIGFHMQGTRQRPDLTVTVFDPQNVTLEVQQYYLIVTPWMHNTPFMTIRLGVSWQQDEWNTGLDAYFQANPSVWTQAFETRHEFSLASFVLPRAICPYRKLFTYCGGTQAVFDARQFSYGWRVYALNPAP